jgi:hypothetical protein
VLPTALALLALNADPLAVLVASKRAGAEQLAPKVTARVRARFPGAMEEAPAAATAKAAGVDPKSCQGATECLGRVAKAIAPNAIVVGVDVGKIAKTLAVHLEAVSADGASLAVADVTLSADKWQAGLDEPLAAFARELTGKLDSRVAERQTAPTPEIAKNEPAAAKPTAEPAPAPLTPREEPSTASSSTTLTRAQPQPSRSRVLPFVCGGVALAALATSGIFGVLGFNEKSVVDGSIGPDGISMLTQSEYAAHKNGGNLDLTIALSTVIAGAALGVLAGILFALN